MGLHSATIQSLRLQARDEQGIRCLDKADDFVRIEIASALKQNKLVIPVLVQDTQMPKPDELPKAIRPLSRRNAVRLTHERRTVPLSHPIGLFVLSPSGPRAETSHLSSKMADATFGQCGCRITSLAVKQV